MKELTTVLRINEFETCSKEPHEPVEGLVGMQGEHFLMNNFCGLRTTWLRPDTLLLFREN